MGVTVNPHSSREDTNGKKVLGHNDPLLFIFPYELREGCKEHKQIKCLLAQISSITPPAKLTT